MKTPERTQAETFQGLHRGPLLGSQSGSYSPEATVTQQRLVWKRVVFKQGILKSLFSHVLYFKSWIKLIYDKITYIFFVMNEFNQTFDIQKMGNEAF